MVDVLNATAPRAWSADLYDQPRNAYRNNELRVKMLHPVTTECVLCYVMKIARLTCLSSNLQKYFGRGL